MTKALTGIALLELHEAGAVDLDAPIQRYVPAFPEKPGGTITLRLLAAHVAGIRHWNDGERTPALYATHFDDVSDIVNLFKDDPFVAAPGAEYNYSSPGYILVGAAVHVYPDDDLVTVVLSNTHGVGARSGEMVDDLSERLAAFCLGWPRSGAARTGAGR